MHTYMPDCDDDGNDTKSKQSPNQQLPQLHGENAERRKLLLSFLIELGGSPVNDSEILHERRKHRYVKTCFIIPFNIFVFKWHCSAFTRLLNMRIS